MFDKHSLVLNAWQVSEGKSECLEAFTEEQPFSFLSHFSIPDTDSASSSQFMLFWGKYFYLLPLIN